MPAFRPLIRVLALCGVAASAGCAVNVPGYHAVVSEFPVAVGAFTSVGVVDCDAVRVTKYDGCDGVTVRSFEVDDPSILAVEDGRLRAVKEGRTHVTVRVADGSAVGADVVTKDIDSIKIEYPPRGDCTGDAAKLVPVGESRTLYVTVFGDGEPLSGGFSEELISADDGSVVHTVERPTVELPLREVSLLMRPTPGEVKLTSPRDPELDFRLVAYDFSSVERFDLTSSLPTPWGKISNGPGYREQTLVSVAIVGGARACFDSYERAVRTQTPEVCKILSDNTPYRIDAGMVHGSLFEAQPMDAGTCVIEAALADGGFPTVGQFVVAPL